MKKKAQYIGEILIDKGLITKAQLEEVIQEQLRNKKFIGMMLVQRGLISERELIASLAEQFGIDHVSLKKEDVDWDLALKFSASLVTDHKCLPVRADKETVTLAITNPLDVWVLDKAEKEAAPRKLKVVLTTLSDMDEMIKEYRRASIQKMMTKWKQD
jgi:type IV pilus assembly protein PilB